MELELNAIAARKTSFRHGLMAAIVYDLRLHTGRPHHKVELSLVTVQDRGDCLPWELGGCLNVDSELNVTVTPVRSSHSHESQCSTLAKRVGAHAARVTNKTSTVI